MMFMII